MILQILSPLPTGIRAKHTWKLTFEKEKKETI